MNYLLELARGTVENRIVIEEIPCEELDGLIDLGRREVDHGVDVATVYAVGGDVEEVVWQMGRKEWMI